MHKLRMLSLSSLSVASLSLISGIIIAITSLGGVNASSLTPYPFHIPGMMGTNMMGTQNMTTQLVSVQQAIKMMHNDPTYAKVNSKDNTINFGAKNASIVALSMMLDDAVNITGTHPLNCFITGCLYPLHLSVCFIGRNFP